MTQHFGNLAIYPRMVEASPRYQPGLRVEPLAIVAVSRYFYLLWIDQCNWFDSGILGYVLVPDWLMDRINVGMYFM